MTDTSSSARNAPSSSVVCPFAKLGHLSPSTAAAAAAGAVGVTRISPHRSFKAASSVESLNYSRSSDLSCSDGGSVNKNNNLTTYSPLSVSPAYRPHQQMSCRRSPVHNRDGDELRFFRGGRSGEKQDGDCTRMAFGPQQQTSFGCYTSGRTSPYLDLGYHTLVAPSGWPTSVVSVGKCTKKTANKSKRSYHMERLPDVVMLQIFSWLSTSELCSVSRVCRRWHNLAWEHALWKRITLHGEGRCADEAIKSILRRLCGQGQNDACTSVKQLYVFDGAKITDKGLTSLSRRCTELTQVQIQNCPTVSDAAVSELVTRCPSIQHLDLTGCSLVSCINILTGSDRPQKLLLQHLDLTDCVAVQDSSLRIILRNCPLLTYLYLRRCCRITDAGVKFVPSFCSSLRELSVSDCHLVTDFALYELAKLGSNLRYLSVAKCGQVSDAGLKVIAKRCYKLRYLNVRGCEAVSDDALTALARSCPRLRALDIGKCDVSDAGLKVLAENCPNLKKLSLRNCDLVTDLGVQYVCYYCRGLQQLNIQDCQISLEGYRAVKRFCKRCIIEHTNPGFF